jgi:hypothetical protein
MVACESISARDAPSTQYPTMEPFRLRCRSVRHVDCPGSTSAPSDSAALLRLLRRQTDLPDYIIEVFGLRLRTGPDARLLAVELGKRVLTDIGYFID